LEISSTYLERTVQFTYSTKLIVRTLITIIVKLLKVKATTYIPTCYVVNTNMALP